MALINRKVELKLKWPKYCVFADNVHVNSSNIVFTIKDAKLCSCSSFISKKESKTIKTPKQRIWKIRFLEIQKPLLFKLYTVTRIRCYIVIIPHIFTHTEWIKENTGYMYSYGHKICRNSYMWPYWYNFPYSLRFIPTE